MRFLGAGVSHRTAPIELREKLAKATANLEEALAALRQRPLVEEACIVSTCNRVEFYVAGEGEPAALARELRSFLQSASEMRIVDVDPHLYQHEGVDGLRHLFRVAASLDSMVLGEPQILGQVKEAFAAAQRFGAAGALLNKVFPRAFQVAKRVRTETGIAENAVSMSFAAVELAREIFQSFEEKSVLLIGAGKMSTLAAKHLKNLGVSEIRVANRSIERATELAREVGGTASSLEDLEVLLQKADIVISSTAAPGFVVEKKLMSKVVKSRRYRPILFVDLAVPRDIDPKVGDLDQVFVYDVDELQGVVEENRSARAKEAEDAERIIDEELTSFIRWSRSQQVVPVIKALREKALGLAELEAQRTLANLKASDPKVEQSVRRMAEGVVNKLLHPVLTTLKQEGAEGDPSQLVETLRVLFELEIPSGSLPPEPAPAETPNNVVPIPRDRGQGQGGGS